MTSPSDGRLKSDSEREREERLRLAAQATGFGVYDHDFLTQTAFYSPEFLALFGLPPDATLELDSDQISTGLHPNDRETFFALMRAACDPTRSGILDLEYRIFRTDGELRWLRVRGQPTFSGTTPSARAVRARGFVQDVTERKTALEQLATENLKYETLLRTTNDGVHILDLEGRVKQTNPAFCRMLGYSSEEMATLRVTDWDANLRPHAVRETIAKLVAQPQGFETRYRRRNGELVDVEVNAVCVEIDGQLLLYAAARDTTARKRAEAALRSAAAYARSPLEANPDPLVTRRRGPLGPFPERGIRHGGSRSA